MDYWLWKETWGGEATTIDTSTDTTTDSTETTLTTSTSEQKTLNGGKIGSHYRFGVEILLDKFDRVGESKLYNNFRIEDTYLVVEQRFLMWEKKVLSLMEKQRPLVFVFIINA